MKKRNLGFWVKPLLLGAMLGALSLAGCSDGSTTTSALDNETSRQKVIEPGMVCPSGGAEIESGIDTNANGVLDDSEVTTSDVICNGVDGAADSSKAVQAESCVICHSDTGSMHQASYDELYQDGVIKVTDLAYAYAPDTAMLTFKMTKNGSSFDCNDADSIGSYFVEYDGTGFPSDLSLMGTKTYDAGTNVCTSTKTITGAEDLSLKTGVITLYGTDEIVYRNSAKHISSGKYPFAAILKLGTVGYESVANTSGCENCHTEPFLKHTYIYGKVDGGNEFYTCKGCHFDERTGGHEDWQILVDNPARAAEIAGGSAKTDAEKVQYAYKAKLMNDVHMSHAMEFGYPQSMSNCSTCHEGKLDRTLTDANFTAETCKSCHPVTGPEEGTDSHRAPALMTLWKEANVATFHTITSDCKACHNASGNVARGFDKIHSGYNDMIYTDAAGTRYSDVFTVMVDNASLDENNMLTVNFSATKDPADTTTTLMADAIVPTIMVGLYGYDTKDYIVSPHGRDENRVRLLEYAIGSENPRFTTVTATGGSWEVTADLSMWAGMIDDKSVKRVEIGVMPQLVNANGTTVALNAPSRTFDLAANAFDDAFFADIVDVAGGCNTCHDALATTFHSANRGGNIKVCRMCHTPESGGSHLEMQSRSIDSYVHAIHSFQPFDPGDIDFTDPVEALHYEHHVGSSYPKFGITDCESCHNKGTYDVPDQSKSLPGKFSAADTFVGMDRSIGAVPSYVAGPASRACGSCHRSQMINEDDAGKLASFNQHTATFGYLVKDEGDTSVWGSVVTEIMSLFN